MEVEAHCPLLTDIYHSIKTTTGLALSFNDNYKDEVVHSSKDRSLPDELMSLDNVLTI